MEIVKEYYNEELIKLADINSLLVESGTTLASLEFDNGYKCHIYTNGYVRLKYNGEWYLYPSDYPQELTDAIKNGKDDKYEIDFNNWVEFEYCDQNGACLSEDFYVDFIDGFGNTKEDAKAIMLDLKNDFDKIMEEENGQ